MMRRLIGYIIYVIGMFFIVKFTLRYDFILLEQTKSTYNPLPYMTYLSLYPVMIGLLLALPALWKQITCTGNWTFDWIKAIVVGIPALFGTCYQLLFFSPWGDYLGFMRVFYFGKEVAIICGIVFGYVLVTSFQKKHVHSDYMVR